MLFLRSICIPVFLLCGCGYSYYGAAEQPAQKHMAGPEIPSSTAVARAIKWNPGHYVLAPFRITDENLQRMLDEISGIKTFRGIQKRYTWASMEPKKDLYDFSEIKRDLGLLKSRNMRLVVQIQHKSFHGDDNYTPGYLQGAEYGGGVFRLSGSGHNLVLWNDAVLDRLKSLYERMGKELDAADNLEAVVVPESSPGRKPDMAPGYDENKYAGNLIEAATTLKKAFPTTVIIQYVNYPRSQLEKMVAALRTSGIGLGGPDTFPVGDDRFLHQGIYPYYSGLAGIIPLAVAVQDDNYTSKKPLGAYNPTPVKDIYLFARDKLRVNYMFWLWKKEPVDYFSGVIRMMKEQDDQSDIYGGLRSGCPVNHGNCLKQ